MTLPVEILVKFFVNTWDAAKVAIKYAQDMQKWYTNKKWDHLLQNLWEIIL